MTIRFPDVSNHQAGLRLIQGTPIVIAKATEGSSFVDSQFIYFKKEANRIGAKFLGYHWLNTADASAQAAHCYGIVGSKIPLMIDVENGAYTPVSQVKKFVNVYRSLGGVVHLYYMPKWYWTNNGKEDLNGLVKMDMNLVSSQYTNYSDNGPGWQPYAKGQPKPVQWQYTDNQLYNMGMKIDFNAYLGTVEEYWNMVRGIKPQPTPPPVQRKNRNPLLIWREHA